MEEALLEKRKEKLKKQFFSWIKKPHNLTLLAVLLFAFVIRLYYFIKVGAQPLWWDEACYGSLAKNLISHLWDGTFIIEYETLIRPFFFPFIWSLLLRIGIPEMGIRFILEFIPSILSVFFVYLVGKEVFGKRAGIISAFIFSVLWIHLFYTVRLLTNVPALVFLFVSIYLFIKSTKSEFNFKLFSVSLILLSISTLIRYPNGIIFFVYLFMLILNRQFFIKKLKFWYSGLIGIFPVLLFFLYNFITQGNIFPALLAGKYVGASEIIAKPLAFNLLSYIPIYLKNIFFIFFILGIIIILFELLVGYNLIPNNKRLKNYLLLILILIGVYSFFIFYMRVAEDRWLFATSLPICCIAGFGVDSTYKFIKKYNKYFAIALVFCILFFGAYSQIKFADNLIENKQVSYLQIRQGFEWIKENTPQESIIIGNAIQPYAIYYSERQHLDLPKNYSSGVQDDDADYLVDHVFVPRPDYMDQYLNENKDKWNPINAFFFDSEQKQPALIIYQKIDSRSEIEVFE